MTTSLSKFWHFKHILLTCSDSALVDHAGNPLTSIFSSFVLYCLLTWLVISLAVGKVNPQVAFLSGKLKLQGNLAKAMTFNTNVFQKPTIKNKIVDAVKKIQSSEKIPSKL